MDPVHWLTRNRTRLAIALALFVLVGVPLHLAMKESSWAFNPTLLPLNSRAPHLQGPTLDGGAFDSATEFGRVKIYVFIDPTLRSSDRQGKMIRKWREMFDLQRVRIVPVLCGGTTEQQEKYAEQYELDRSLTVVDSGNIRAPKFNVQVPPATYVVDGVGRVQLADKKPGINQVAKAVETFQAPIGSRFLQRNK